jgi:hypothetical protein
MCKNIVLSEIVDLTKFQSITHLLIVHAAGRGSRSRDGEVVWARGSMEAKSGGSSNGGKCKNNNF